MSSHNETDDLRARVERHLRDHASLAQDAGRVVVTAVAPLAGGACQENFRVDVDVAGAPRTFVLRSDARTHLPGSIDREAEHAVINAAVGAGVMTPEAQWLSRGLVREGASAYFLDWVDGEAIGRKVVASPALERARAALPAQLARELAKIHGITPAACPAVLDASSLGADYDPVRAHLDRLRKSIDALREPRPATELAYLWLVENARPERETVLVHGDFRTGNFLVGEEGLRALLDWEFSHWGSRYYDLAWICLRDWRFNRVTLPVGGFSGRRAFYDAYERESGVTLDPARLHYWEIVGNLQWAIGSAVQCERVLYGGETDIELLAIGRRACEMELEALRLVERGRL